MTRPGVEVQPDDLAVLAWIIVRLYDGGSWGTMQVQKPEINEVVSRLHIWEIAEGDDD